MASFNKVILMGNLTQDPELKQTAGGISVTRFSIAVNRRFGKNNDQGQNVDFINIVAWRQSAEFVCRYFKKGKSILVCGQLQTGTWTDNQGQKRNTVEVVADEVSFAGNNENGGSSAPSEGGHYTPDAYSTPSFNNAPSANFEEIPNDESLPF